MTARTRRACLAGCALLTALVRLADAQSGAPRPGLPTPPVRDTPARRAADATPAGSLSGRVLAADTGRPLARVRVTLSGPEMARGRSTTTGADGVYRFTEVPDGRYSVTATKSGFIALSYGQRRPLQPGTPLEVAHGDDITGIEIRLPHGSAVAGRVADENGDAMPGIQVQVLRYGTSDGTRQFVMAGAAQTDDKGQYRVWGLNPGEYFVSATDPTNARGGFGGFGGFGGGGRGALPTPAELPPTGYAPTYFPGVSSIAEARPVTVDLGAEALDVNFNVLLVKTAVVSGRVANSDGSSTWAGNVTLVPDGGGMARGPVGAAYASRVGYDGAFSITSVPPGRYTLRVRSTMRDEPSEFAAIPVTVNGSPLDLTVSLSAGARLTGTVVAEGAGAAPADLTQFRVSLPLVDDSSGPTVNARAAKDGTFTVDAVPDGLHWVQGQAPRGWMLKSAVVGGRDVTDAPIETRSGQEVKDARLVFTNRLPEVNGTLTDNRGQPATDLTVLAFPVDATLWRPQARQILTARPDQNGKFQLRGLPPGEYYLVPVDPAAPDEWYEPAFLDDHRRGATRVTVREGEATTENLTIVRR